MKRLGQQLMLRGIIVPCFLLFGCERPTARTEPPPPKVSVQQPQVRQLVDYDQYHGWLDATATVEVRARVRGHIDKVDFTDGQIVQANQVLFELDDRPFKSQAQAANEQQRIYVAQLARAKSEEVRLKEMHTRGVAADTEVEKAVATTQSLEAQIDAQKQEIRLRELDVEYAKVTAPIAGRVSRAMLTPGNLVNAGGTDPVLTTIVAIDPIDLYFYVDERSMQRYQKEKSADHPRAQGVKELQIPVQFALESDQGFPRTGVIDFADNKVDPTTGTILVRAQAPNKNGQLFAGSSVRVRVAVAGAQTVTTVPDVAIQSDQDKKYLLVVDPKNIVQRREVQLGKLLDDGMRVILPGGGTAQPLRPEDWLIVDGLQSARVNYAADPVRPATQPSKVANAVPASDREASQSNAR
ncbi:MAG TPA: efflux RND transporter periplasmic adaptor subunit [Tepidisphaeraceae bacterium]|jgi:RND family efflux transporter MFP subunit